MNVFIDENYNNDKEAKEIILNSIFSGDNSTAVTFFNHTRFDRFDGLYIPKLKEEEKEDETKNLMHFFEIKKRDINSYDFYTFILDIPKVNALMKYEELNPTEIFIIYNDCILFFPKIKESLIINADGTFKTIIHKNMKRRDAHNKPYYVDVEFYEFDIKKGIKIERK